MKVVKKFPRDGALSGTGLAQDRVCGDGVGASSLLVLGCASQRDGLRLNQRKPPHKYGSIPALAP